MLGRLGRWNRIQKRRSPNYRSCTIPSAPVQPASHAAGQARLPPDRRSGALFLSSPLVGASPSLRAPASPVAVGTRDSFCRRAPQARIPRRLWVILPAAPVSLHSCTGPRGLAGAAAVLVPCRRPPAYERVQMACFLAGNAGHALEHTKIHVFLDLLFS
jgi:hypothetical protein